MNRMKWANSEVPLEVVALKLCEEAGEVGNVITENLMRQAGPMTSQDVENLMNECEHVIFLAQVIKNRARRIRPIGGQHD